MLSPKLILAAFAFSSFPNAEASVADINQPPELLSSTSTAGYYSMGTLTSGQSITFGTQLTLTMQSVGNLVLYKQGAPVWFSSTTGPNGSNCNSACKMVFQSTGNLVLYQGASTAYWYNTTASNSGYKLKLSTEAPFLTIVNSANEQKWPAFSTYPISVSSGCHALRTQHPVTNTSFLGHKNSTCTNDVGGSPAQYSLRLYSFDWTTRAASHTQAVFDPAATSVTVAGYTIAQAFDPAATVDANGTVWVAFECVVTNSTATLSSSCVGPLQSNGTMDTSRISIPVVGTTLSSASVPKIAYFQGKFYLYWSKVDMSQPNDDDNWLAISQRGIELKVATDGRLQPVNSAGTFLTAPIATNHSDSVEVFAPTSSDARSDIAADAFQAFPSGDYLYLTTASGGHDSVGPCLWTENRYQRGDGCYRMNVRRTKTPLATHAFMGESVAEALLPTTPAAYTTLAKAPGGDYQILTYFWNAPLKSQEQQVPTGMSLMALPESAALLDAKADAAYFHYTLATGLTVPAAVVLTNAGIGPWKWTTQNPISLGAVSTADHWGLNRVGLGTNAVVLPGAQKTFNFNATAPSTAGPYNFQWQMVDDGVAWFGQTTSLIPVTAVVPSASGSWNSNSSFAAVKAVDGDATTRWAANVDGNPVWHKLDLGASILVKKVYVQWETAGAYKIEVSVDGTNYVTVHTATAASNTTSLADFSGNQWGGYYARYMRISPNDGATQYRSIYNIAIVR